MPSGLKFCMMGSSSSHTTKRLNFLASLKKKNELHYKIILQPPVGSNFDFYQEPQGFEDPIGSFFFQECLWSKNFYQLVTQEQIFTLMHGDEKVVCEIFR